MDTPLIWSYDYALNVVFDTLCNASKKLLCPNTLVVILYSRAKTLVFILCSPAKTYYLTYQCIHFALMSVQNIEIFYI